MVVGLNLDASNVNVVVITNNGILSDVINNSAIFPVKENRFFILAGPCVIEDEESPYKIAEKLLTICNTYDIPFVFKGSYRKANRSRLDSFMGIGDEKALSVLAGIKKEFNIPVVTDIHAVEEAQTTAVL